MSWVVYANNEEGDCCHMGEFETREEAEEHFEWCLKNYYSATPPNWEEDL